MIFATPMKILTRCLSAFAVLLTLASCQGPSSSGISGTIAGFENQEVVLFSSTTGQFQPVDTAMADASGSFSFDGNPLAVIMGARNLTTEQVQAIMLEFKHPECILVLPPEGLRDIVVVPVSRAVISL